MPSVGEFQLLDDKDSSVYLVMVDTLHAEALHELTQDVEIYVFMPWGRSSSVHEMQSLILDLKERIDYDFGVDYTIVRKLDDSIVGMISLNEISRTHRKADIGYWLGKRFWGRGYMHDAQVLLINHAFDTLRLHRISALVSPRNTASKRTLLRSGFTYEGTMRDESYWKGRFHSHEIWSLLSTDPRPEFVKNV